MIRVPVQCTVIWPTGSRCTQYAGDHVHTPLPCENGQPERHHEFLPPTSITIMVGDQKRCLRFPRVTATNDGVTVNVEPVDG